MIKLLAHRSYPVEIKQLKYFENGLEVHLIKWGSNNYSVTIESGSKLITSKFHDSEDVAKLEFSKTCYKIDKYKIIS